MQRSRGVLGQSEGRKEKVAEANKGNGYGQFRAIEVKRWVEVGYYLSLLLLTGETRTGEKKMDG